jgi:hypothetical protein
MSELVPFPFLREAIKARAPTKIIARQVLFLRKETGRQSATGGPSATYSSFG